MVPCELTDSKGASREQRAVNLDHNKALLTFASCDRALWLVANGSEEDLSMFVGDPQTFISKRKETVIVVVDEVYYYDTERRRGRDQL